MIQLTYFILERILLGARILDIDKVLLRLTQNIDSNITNMLYLYIIDSFIKVYNNEN